MQRRVAKDDYCVYIVSSMRITVDVDPGELNELLQITGEKKMSPAIGKVISEFIKRKKARDFGRMLREGAFDYGSTNEDIEAQDR